MLEGNIKLTEIHEYYTQASTFDKLFQTLAKEIALEFLALQAQ